MVGPSLCPWTMHSPGSVNEPLWRRRECNRRPPELVYDAGIMPNGHTRLSFGHPPCTAPLVPETKSAPRVRRIVSKTRRKASSTWGKGRLLKSLGTGRSRLRDPPRRQAPSGSTPGPASESRLRLGPDRAERPQLPVSLCHKLRTSGHALTSAMTSSTVTIVPKSAIVPTVHRVCTRICSWSRSARLRSSGRL